jgi:hypothetical protein
MKKIILLSALLLASCTAAQEQAAVTDVSTGISLACADVNLAAKSNPSSNVLDYVNASCATEQAVAALPQTVETIQWLGQLAQQVKAGS